MFRFAYHLAGNREDAEDLVQTAFLQLHRTLERGAEPANPRAWLVVVVKRRAFNLWRDRRDTPSDQIETLATALVDAPNDAPDELEKVRATLWSLPESQHQAFVLRHWSGLSHAEIASVLNTTPAAVESLLVRARAAVIAEDGSDEACMAIRARLCEGAALAPLQVRHLETCRRCSTARSRLARATGIAAAMVLVPRAHVAQALAGTIPGFTAKAALAGAATSGTGASGAAVTGAAGKTGLIAKGALAAVALAGTAGVLHAHVGWSGGSPGPAFHHPLPVASRTALPGSSAEAPVHWVLSGSLHVAGDLDPHRADHDARFRRAHSNDADTGTASSGSGGSSDISQGGDGQTSANQGSGAQQSNGGDGSGADSSGGQDSGGSSAGGTGPGDSQS